MNKFYFFFFILLTPFLGVSQYIDGNIVKYGNEWIDYSKEYFKMSLEEDGIYRISKEELEAVNFPVNSVEMKDFSMFFNGIEIPIHTTGTGIMENNDYIEFYGERNKNQIDQFSFDDKTDQLNTQYSLLNDQSHYYLTFDQGTKLRYNSSITNLPTNLPPVETHYRHKESQYFTNQFIKSFEGQVRYSTTRVTEGFGTALNTNANVNFSTSHSYTNGANPIVRVRFGTNNVQHVIRLSVGNSTVDQYNFTGYRVVQGEAEFSKGELDGQLTVNLKGTDSGNDKFSLSEAEIEYPREFKFDGASTARFQFDQSVFDRYFELQNFDLTAGNPIFYDLNNNRRIQSTIENTLVKLLSPSSLVGNDFLVINDNSVKKVEKINKVEWNNILDLETNYLILSHSKLFEDSETGANYVQEYADYRASNMGGGYNTQVVDVTDIYEQFGYGHDMSYLAIKSYLNYVYENNENLAYFFIIGKAREYGDYRSQSERSADTIFHVPTFGFPGSDNVLSSRWGETTPLVPVGRLACRNTGDILTYLNKVKEHENIINLPQTVQDKLWLKKVVHLSGGDPSIQELIRNYLNSMEFVIENNGFGGDVTTFYKVSSDPIENSQAENIKNIINDGASILTFFGHSAVGVFDLNLEDVSSYDNKGKYPLILSLGCHSGNIHTSARGLSEQFVIEPDKGSIAFLAASSQAFIPPQRELGINLYRNIGNELYDQTLGFQIREMLLEREANNSSSQETLMEQFTLHGDPAIKIHVNPGPDYTPSFSSVKLEPEIINAFQDSFKICFDAANLGLNLDSTYSIKIIHTGPDEQINIDTNFVRITPSFVENHCITLPLNSQDLVGKNKIKIRLDQDNAITELPNPDGEFNNELVNNNGGEDYEFFILNNGAVPVAPKNFSIYTEEKVKLQASSFNALGTLENFIIQLDTLGSFDSPFLLEHIITDATGLITWEPDINFIPGKVYYWRVSPQNSNSAGPGIVWNSSSFIYLPNSTEGFNQSHFNQFEDNSFNELKLVNGKLDFVSNVRDYRIINLVRDGETFPKFFVGTVQVNNGYIYTAGARLAVFVADSLGRIRWNPVGIQYGESNLWNGPNRSWYFNPLNKQSRIDLVNFLEEQTEDGDYVFFYTIMPENNYAPNFANEDWALDSLDNDGKNIFNVLKEQGSQFIDGLRSGQVTPYNFMYRKNKESLSESLAETTNDYVDNTVPLFGKWFTGTETSVKIGPATKWRKLVWDDELSEIPANDSSYVNIFGVLPDGRDTLIRDHILEKEINLAPISAEQFPYLKLQYYTYDRTDFSSPNLIFWRVFFDGLPELALNILDDQAVFQSDTIDQGNDFLLKIPLENIGMVDVDSIEVKITLTDSDNAEEITFINLSPIAAGDKEYITYSIPTKNLNGEYIISIEANLKRSPEECFYFNNFGLRKFVIRQDLRNPLLDVSFDGRRIMNGDIVSAQPLIRIVTKDENKFLLLDDTSAYDIALIYPSGNEELIEMNDPRIVFIPANSNDDNRSEIEFRPVLEEDGIYTLVVSAKDRSDNLSGNKAFSVEFEIINEELVSNVFNYPNPFSNCTQFVFTLTGNDMPEDISIRIMTVSGKTVKEISGAELGPLHIGVNRTEYKWDGTDEYGSKLANGVYLYQVNMKKNDGSNYEKYDTGTDQFFKRNIGKLVIIR